MTPLELIIERCGLRMALAGLDQLRVEAAHQAEEPGNPPEWAARTIGES